MQYLTTYGTQRLCVDAPTRITRHHKVWDVRAPQARQHNPTCEESPVRFAPRALHLGALRHKPTYDALPRHALLKRYAYEPGEFRWHIAHTTSKLGGCRRLELGLCFRFGKLRTLQFLPILSARL